MSIWTLFLLALALCVDSFIVSITIGVQKNITTLKGALFSLLCALFQGILPLLGMFLGGFFKTNFDNYDHWIAFILLFLIGLKMLIEARKAGKNELAYNLFRPLILLGLALATSIDAFVVGVGLGFTLADLHSEIIAACIIGGTTFFMSIAGIYLGRKQKFIPVKFTTALGGLVLIGLGIKFLIEHNAFSFC